MGRKRIYIANDVVSEAKLRVRRILDIHDTVVVAYSGGKDSWAVVQLLKEVYDDEGIKDPVKCWFRDEEVIPQSVVDWVRSTSQLDWIDLEWWAVPLKGTYFLMGEIHPYIQWDPQRDWVRKKPEWSLREADLGIAPGTVLDQFSCDQVKASRHKGKLAILNGIRTDESIYRLASVFAKRHDCYICASQSSVAATLCKPIYDWKEMDVLKYLHDKQAGLCLQYDSQGWSGQALRVATAINVQSAKHFDKLRESDPDLYENVLRAFPQMAIQARYWGEFSGKENVDPKYLRDLNGVRQWVRDHIDDPGASRKALQAIDKAEPRITNAPHAYPMAGVLSQIRSQGENRPILPTGQGRKK